MGLYYVERGDGRCSISEAYSIAQARKEAIQAIGTDIGVNVVRKATHEDIGWVQGMGGFVPGKEPGGS